MTRDELVQKILLTRPNAQWALYNGTYEGLVWLDELQTKPTEAELEAA